MAAETWMSADECKSMGLIDEVIVTSNKKPVAKNISELHNFYNKLLNPIKMLKVTNLLKLSNDASEEAIVESINKIENEKTELKNKVDALTKDIDETKAKLKSFEDAEAQKEVTEKASVIENAIKEKKTDESKKEFWTKSSFTSVELKNMFDAIKVPFSPVFNKAASGATNADRATWTYTDWSKKDPAGLAELQKNAPTEFENLVKGLPSQLSVMYNPETDKKF